jgi:hypothetical protein
VEHPHSAFLRKPIDHDGKPGIRTTLFAPDGKLHEERLVDGTVLEYFVKKPNDFKTLRGFLRDMDLLATTKPQNVDLLIGTLGKPATDELGTRWADQAAIEKAKAEENEALASCLRKLERQMKHRAEQAVELGYSAVLTAALDIEPDGSAIHLLEWLKHISPVYIELEPTQSQLETVAHHHAGVRCRLNDLLSAADGLEPPQGSHILLDASVQELADADVWLKAASSQMSILILLDCTGIDLHTIVDALTALIE